MFDTLTSADAEAFVRPPDGLDAARKYVGAPTPDDPDGVPDHWQKGEGITAPMPDPSDPNAAAYGRALEAAFVVEDCTSDVWERKVNGLLGHEPHWSIEPDRDEDGELDAERDPDAEAVEGFMRAWWARQAGGMGAGKVLREWVGGMALCGRSYLRVSVPSGRLTEVASVNEDGETVTQMRLAVKTPEEALRHIFVEHVYADQAAVHTDRDTRAAVGVVTFAAEDGPRTDGADPAVSTVETSYLETTDDGSPTVLKVTRGDTEERMSLDLGGRLTLFEGRMRPTITPSVIANQRDLNTYRTMAAINSHRAGFPELIFIDVEAPTDADGNAVDYESGPASSGFMVSVPRYDATGQPAGSASGSVTRFGPVDNAALRGDATVAREAIYRGAKQFHVLALSGANLSGEAMIQGQGEFLNDLLDGKQVADAGGRWLLEAPWRLACAIVNQPERAGTVRAVFDCRPSAGPLSAAIRAEILKQNEKGLLSDESTMSLLGVDDIEAERGRIAAEAQAKAEANFNGFAAANGMIDPAVTPSDIDPNTTPAEAA